MRVGIVCGIWQAFLFNILKKLDNDNAIYVFFGRCETPFSKLNGFRYLKDLLATHKLQEKVIFCGKSQSKVGKAGV